MEILRMDYRFTAILIVMMTLLALFGGPAHSRNEYLNEYGARCGDMEVRTERRDTDYNYSDNSTCLLYTSPSPRDRQKSRMPSSA